MDKILEYAKEVNQINSHPFFINLANADINKSPQFLREFVITQEVFKYAVYGWPKVLSSLMVEVDDDSIYEIISQDDVYDARMIIMRNLWDEHGNGVRENAHYQTYARYLQSIRHLAAGYDFDNIGRRDESTHTFIAILVDKQSQESQYRQHKNSIGLDWPIFHVAAVAMIEYMYITISANIHNYVAQFIDPNDIEHYSLHELMDVTHSTELFSIVQNEKPAVVKAGIDYGYSVFYDLYTDYVKDMDKYGQGSK